MYFKSTSPTMAVIAVFRAPKSSKERVIGCLTTLPDGFSWVRYRYLRDQWVMVLSCSLEVSEEKCVEILEQFFSFYEFEDLLVLTFDAN